MKLIDSNICIYAAKPEYQYLKEIILNEEIAISKITWLEIMGSHKLTEEEREFFESILIVANMVDIDDKVIEKAIEIRQGKSVKVGDAIIGATAILNSYELITRNVADFKHLTAITVTNPIDK